jgi:BatD DUF11 like domain
VSPRAAMAVATVGVVALAPAAGLAQASQPQMSAHASATQVEVGESFSIELRASVDQGGPEGPEIRLPSAFAIGGQSSIQFGSFQKRGLQVTWQITARKAGRYSIPGPTVIWNGQRYATNPIAINVVPASGKPRQQQQPQQQGLQGMFGNPFLRGPGMQIPWLFGEDEPDDELEDRDAKELSLPTAPDARLFLHGVVDKKSAVIGEQVVLSFYLYARVHFRLQEMMREAPLADFRRVSLVANPGVESSQRTRVGRDWYQVTLVDRMAVYPLRAGDIHTGTRSGLFSINGLGANQRRETEDLVIHVTEPPLAGRPPGYRLGDVGDFALSATVEPRRIKQGGEAAVTIKVTGTGNFPESLRVPERTGLEWLDPEKKESIGPQAGAIGGFRSFGYVVRVKESGRVALGDVALPYWEPASKRYEVARVSLGALDVEPVAPADDPGRPKGSDPAAPEEPTVDPFVALGAPRATLGAFIAPKGPIWSEGWALWLLVAAPPLAVALGFGGAGAIARLRSRRAEASAAPTALAHEALQAADEAEAKGDKTALAVAVERAIHLSIEGATGFKSRGALRNELPAELEEHGVPRALGDRIKAALSECEVIRFEPASAPPADGGTGGLGARARALVDEIDRIEAP